MTELAATGLTLKVRDDILVNDATFTLAQGELIVLLGPNGAGKTSLIRSSLGLEPLTSGTARLNGADVTSLDPIARARAVAYLPQQRPLAWPARVRDVIALGRYSHGAALGRLRDADADAVDRAIVACHLTHLANRPADTLSGGELARMHCARAFAAEAPLLIADEPTGALDPRHQFRIMDLVKSFVDGGGGALVVLHDIQLAARYASRLIWMQEGCIIADGPPSQTLTTERLETVYGVSAQIDGTRIEMDGAL